MKSNALILRLFVTSFVSAGFKKRQIRGTVSKLTNDATTKTELKS